MTRAKLGLASSNLASNRSASVVPRKPASASQGMPCVRACSANGHQWAASPHGSPGPGTRGPNPRTRISWMARRSSPARAQTARSAADIEGPRSGSASPWRRSTIRHSGASLSASTLAVRMPYFAHSAYAHASTRGDPGRLSHPGPLTTTVRPSGRSANHASGLEVRRTSDGSVPSSRMTNATTPGRPARTLRSVSCFGILIDSPELEQHEVFEDKRQKSTRSHQPI
jgi:hypothetical protein